SERREVRRELDRERDVELLAQRAHELEISALEVCARVRRIGRGLAEIQLRGGGPGLLDTSSVLDPAARARAVQARQNGNPERALGRDHELEIAGGVATVAGELG